MVVYALLALGFTFAVVAIVIVVEIAFGVNQDDD